jgi:membrane protein insertase Oxa1/YidC/SpoIIIJ
MKKRNFKTKDFIDGAFLVNQTFIGWLPVIFVVLILIILYITNRYNIEKTAKEIDKLETEIGYLQKKHSEQKGLYQKQTQMLELEKILAEKGIKVSKEEQKQIILIPENSNKKKEDKK